MKIRGQRILDVNSIQTDEVLSKDSAAEVEDGKTPGPMIEVRFWEAKCMNLESLFEQVKSYSDYKYLNTFHLR